MEDKEKVKRIVIPIDLGAGIGLIVGIVLSAMFSSTSQELTIWIGGGAPQLGRGLVL